MPPDFWAVITVRVDLKGFLKVFSAIALVLGATAISVFTGTGGVVAACVGPLAFVTFRAIEESKA